MMMFCKKHFYKNLIAFIMCLNIFLGTVLSVNASDSDWYAYDEAEHKQIDFSQVQYVGYDSSLMETCIKELEKAIQISGNEEAVLKAFDEVVSQIDAINKQTVLAEIEYYEDFQDELRRENYEKMEMLQLDVVNEGLTALQDALKTEYREQLVEHIGNMAVVESIDEYENVTEEEKELEHQVDQLVSEYDRKFSEDDYASCVEIYGKMVPLRNKIAKLHGYENFAEYAYKEIYNRDYNKEDIKEVYKQVKRYFVPLYREVLELLVNHKQFEAIYGEMPIESGLEMVERVAPIVEKIHPDLMDSYRYMSKYHWYDLEDNEKKFSTGFTTQIYSDRACYIFDKPNGSYDDLITLIHEFGHYNEKFHNMNHAAYDLINMDTAEIYSQGLELLSLEYMDELYDDAYVDVVKYAVLYKMIHNSVIEGCLYDEFQNIVYASDKEWSAADLNRLYNDLSKEYGLYYLDDPEENDSWVYVSHTFQSPMYYISYATSALAAMDIFRESLNNREAAINHYMQLTTIDSSVPYREAVKQANVADIFATDSVGDIAIAIEKYLRTVKKEQEDKEAVLMMKKVALIVTISIIVLIILSFVIKRILKSKKQNAEDVKTADSE